MLVVLLNQSHHMAYETPLLYVVDVRASLDIPDQCENCTDNSLAHTLEKREYLFL